MEDVLKDLFFIGSGTSTQPGRRHSKKSSYDGIREDTESTEDDATRESRGSDKSPQQEIPKEVNPPTVVESVSSTLEPQPSNQSMVSDDPLTAVWDYMGGSITAVFAWSDPLNNCISVGDETFSSFKVTSGASVRSEDSEATGIQKESQGYLMDLASDLLFSQNSADLGGMDEETVDETLEGTISYTLGDNSLESRSFQSLSKEGSLLELAQCAARSKHELKQVVFDGSAVVDVVNEIKFSVVTLPLPLGLLFQENSGGCSVTKVFESGNAALSSKVMVGDQLAAINGTSTVKLKVEDISSMISAADNPKEIELTFLRYVGPLKPMPGTAAPKNEVKAESSSPKNSRPNSPEGESSRKSTREPRDRSGRSRAKADHNREPAETGNRGRMRSRSIPSKGRGSDTEEDVSDHITHSRSMEENGGDGKSEKKKRFPFLGRRKKQVA